jgi:hypothetical protein
MTGPTTKIFPTIVVDCALPARSFRTQAMSTGDPSTPAQESSKTRLHDVVGGVVASIGLLTVLAVVAVAVAVLSLPGDSAKGPDVVAIASSAFGSSARSIALPTPSTRCRSPRDGSRRQTGARPSCAAGTRSGSW